MSSRKAELHARRQRADPATRRELRYTSNNVVYVVNVPVNDIRERGHYITGTVAERSAVHRRIVQCVDGWINLPERRKTEKTITNFCVDVMFLWHLNDPNVELVGPVDTAPVGPESVDKLYWMQVERMSNVDNEDFVHAKNSGHRRLIIPDHNNLEFYVPNEDIKKIDIGDLAQFRDQTIQSFNIWLNAGKHIKDKTADRVIGDLAQLALHDDSYVSFV